jgi:hypothetical protein
MLLVLLLLLLLLMLLMAAVAYFDELDINTRELHFFL